MTVSRSAVAACAEALSGTSVPESAHTSHLHVRGGGWAGQRLAVVPRAGAVVVVTGDPRFDPGPPTRDELPDGRRPALDLVRRHLLPVLLRR